jgi:hypothetical protein
MGNVTLEQAQALEEKNALRLKFASIDSWGDPIDDAGDEYLSFFQDLPQGWSTPIELGEIETRTEAMRSAWHVNGNDVDIVAVEHETGIELIVVGILTPLVVKAITGFAKWGWKRWKELRSDSEFEKVDASLVIEFPRATQEGAAPVRLVIPPPVDATDIERYIELAKTAATAR